MIDPNTPTPDRSRLIPELEKTGVQFVGARKLNKAAGLKPLAWLPPMSGLPPS
jgi:hypothetical protein